MIIKMTWTLDCSKLLLRKLLLFQLCWELSLLELILLKLLLWILYCLLWRRNYTLDNSSWWRFLRQGGWFLIVDSLGAYWNILLGYRLLWEIRLLNMLWLKVWEVLLSQSLLIRTLSLYVILLCSHYYRWMIIGNCRWGCLHRDNHRGRSLLDFDNLILVKILLLNVKGRGINMLLLRLELHWLMNNSGCSIYCLLLRCLSDDCCACRRRSNFYFILRLS